MSSCGVTPGFEDGERPQHAAVILAPREMRAQQSVHDRSVEETALRDACGIQDLAERRTQRATEPLGQRRGEALFATSQGLLWQSVGERVLEEPLEIAEPAETERRRNAADELDEPVIEERRAQLERVRHARAIGVREILSRQVAATESMKETANRIGTGTFAEQRVEIVVRIDVAHLSAKGRAQQAARGPGRKAADEQ